MHARYAPIPLFSATTQQENSSPGSTPRWFLMHASRSGTALFCCPSGVRLPSSAASPFLGSSVHPHVPKAGISRVHRQPAAGVRQHAPGQQWSCCLTRGAESTSPPAEAPGTAGAGGQRRQGLRRRNRVLAQPPGLGDFAPPPSVQPTLSTADGYRGFPREVRGRRLSPLGHKAKTPLGTGRKKKTAQMGRHGNGKL